MAYTTFGDKTFIFNPKSGFRRTFGVGPNGYESGISNTVTVFTLPKSASYIHITAIGAGGHGGDGFANTSVTLNNGGGGGGSGGLSTVIYSTALIPRTLYIQVGVPGANQHFPIGASLGTSQGDSWVRITPDTTTNTNCLIHAFGGYNGNPGGAQAVASIGGAGGFGANTSNISLAAMATLGSAVYFSAGANGASGGRINQSNYGGPATAVSFGTVVSGGSGGPSFTFPSISSNCNVDISNNPTNYGIAPYPFATGGDITVTAANGTISPITSTGRAIMAGNNGVTVFNHPQFGFYSTGGGSGAVGANPSQGGSGGWGGIGSGGGGGATSTVYGGTGAWPNSGGGGRGGAGGFGMVIITCW